MKKNTKILTLVFVVAFLTLLVGCLTPPNQTPIITSTPATTATIGILYTYDVNATDPDGDTLTYSLVAKPMGMTINSASGLIKWTPVATQVGDNSVIVKVSDGSLSIGQRFTIKVSTLPPDNQKPVIYSTPITTATVGVTYFYDVNATDPNGDILTYSLTAYPSGMAIGSASGLIMWIPTTEGNYAVTVEVSDGTLDDIQSFPITVSKPTVPPVNQAPIITSIPSLTATVGVKYTYTINAIDPDGDTITYSLVSGPTGITFNGIATISWIPVLGQVGTHGVIVKASDGKLSNLQSFTITVSAVEPEPEPEIELTGIVVDPKTMTLFVDRSEDIKSVTAHYSDGSTANIAFGDCTYSSNAPKVATISNGVVTTVAEGSATITVIYREEKKTKVVYIEETDTIAVMVTGPVQNITQGTYYNTIQEAIDAADSGNTIIVTAGTYNETINITTDNLTIKSFSSNPSDTIIDPTVNIAHCSGVVLNGFTIANSKHWGVFLNYATDCELSSIIISDVDNPSWDAIGLYLIASTDNSFVDCEISNITTTNRSAYGIYLQAGCDKNTFTSTKVSGIKGKVGTMGILFQLGNSYNTFESTEISNLTVIDDKTASAIVFYNGANNGNEFNTTTISDVTGGTAVGSTYGIILIEGQGNTFSGNNIFDLTGGGKVHSIDLRTEAKNNSFNLGSILGAKYGIYLEGDCSGNSIHNTNIEGNTEYGAYSTKVILDATNNWWGDASGPSGGVFDPVTGIIANGVGDAVSNYVNFDPWTH